MAHLAVVNNSDDHIKTPPIQEESEYSERFKKRP